MLIVECVVYTFISCFSIVDGLYSSLVLYIVGEWTGALEHVHLSMCT